MKYGLAGLCLLVALAPAALGGATRLLVAGGTANQPGVVNGIVNPAIVGVQNDGLQSGAFLTYTAENGFALAAVTFGSHFVGSGDTTIFQTSQAIEIES